MFWQLYLSWIFQWVLFCFPVFFVFASQFWRFLLTYPKAWIFCFQLYAVHWAHQRHSLFWLQGFQPLVFLFASFLEFLSLCIHCTSVFAFYFNHYPCLIIMVFKNFQSDNSNIPVMWKPGSDACSVASNCVGVSGFFWVYLIHFLLKDDVLG